LLELRGAPSGRDRDELSERVPSFRLIGFAGEAEGLGSLVGSGGAAFTDGFRPTRGVRPAATGVRAFANAALSRAALADRGKGVAMTGTDEVRRCWARKGVALTASGGAGGRTTEGRAGRVAADVA
jgi:hypothetical protein